jgi:carbohydrate kinase (thermoresistant glucokinase family)
MVVVVSGVAGSGKTTIGRILAERLDVPYAEADDFHSEANRLRMAAGLPLSDDDREPWLAAIRSWIDGRISAGESGVVTCSALKRSYRDQLHRPDVLLVFLKVDWETASQRLEERRNHFFPAALAQSQFETLEEPQPGEDVLVVDATLPIESVVSQILEAISVRSEP